MGKGDIEMTITKGRKKTNRADTEIKINKREKEIRAMRSLNGKRFLTAVEVEAEMQRTREEQKLTGSAEKLVVGNLIVNAKRNSMVGDKLQMVIEPSLIHIPEWQRKLDVSKALLIGNCYNKYKWEVPKVLFYKGLLYVIDGQHRIYGAFRGGIEAVVVEIMECSMEEAIELFINQSQDRTRMRPRDVYQAALAAQKPEFIKLKEICEKHNVSVGGNDEGKNYVGNLSSISDGIALIRRDAKLLDDILALIGELGWNGYAEKSKGKAYNSKYIRVLRSLYAYYSTDKKAMEKVLLKHCKGTEYFKTELLNLEQDHIFDVLYGIVSREIGETQMETDAVLKRHSKRIKKQKDDGVYIN